MKQIKAYVHQHRAADVIEAIKATKAWGLLDGYPDRYHLAAADVQGTLPPIDDAEQHFSVNLGLRVVNEVRLELHCDDDCVDEIVRAIRASARTGQQSAGWVYVTSIDAAHEIH
jgi:nitrogen regulatory protein P-II 1